MNNSNNQANEPPKIAALYCRLSKNECRDNESNSITNQKIILEKAAIINGYENTQFFIDDGYSGTDFAHPALQQLENAIEAGYICAVIVKDISRLGRDYLKVGYYVEQLFLKYNVRFIAVTGDIDSNTNTSDFLPLYSVMDEWYAKDISRKVRMMYQSKIAKGIPVGLPVYGYMKDCNNPKFWIPEPETAKIVQYIYELAVLGYGSEQIAKQLEQERILTPLHYCISKGYNRKAENADLYGWKSSSVSQILQRQEYCGDILNMKTYTNSFKDKKRRANPVEKMSIIKNVHEPIIDRHLWEYVQQKRENKKNSRRKSGKQPLFSGFLRCGDCGSNMHFGFNQANPSIEFFRCSNYVGNRGGTCPDTHYVRVDFLKKKVLRELNTLIDFAKNNWDLFSEMVTQKEQIENKNQSVALSAEHKPLQTRLKEITSLLARLYEDKITGGVDDETFVLLTSEFKKEREQIKMRTQTIKEILQRSNCIEYGLSYFKKLINQQDKIANLTREDLQKYIDSIAIYTTEEKGENHRQRIEVYYQYIGLFDIKSLSID